MRAGYDVRIEGQGTLGYKDRAGCSLLLIESFSFSSQNSKQPEYIKSLHCQSTLLGIISNAGANKIAAPVVNPRKLDKRPRRCCSVEARLEKKMSQAELAKQINERPREYENGEAVPNQSVLAKMECVLGVKLIVKLAELCITKIISK
ncbi:hypothetical protein QQ045_031614 [Rhodiola kirilowii]